MVAVVAEKIVEARFPRLPASAPPLPRARRVAFVGADDARAKPRKQVALKCWLMDDDGAARGYALDVSESGARLSGVGARYAEGQKLLCKLVLDPKEPPLVVRCKVVRAQGGEVGVRFLELGFDEWFRLGRFVDRR